jgi:hypothetical protein
VERKNITILYTCLMMWLQYWLELLGFLHTRMRFGG